MKADRDHECTYGEKSEGNWTVIGRCTTCDELPPFEFVQAKMQKPTRGKRLTGGH